MNVCENDPLWLYINLCVCVCVCVKGGCWWLCVLPRDRNRGKEQTALSLDASSVSVCV